VSRRGSREGNAHTLLDSGVSATSNLVPEVLVEVYDGFHGNEYVEAVSLQLKIVRAIQEMLESLQSPFCCND
jgi:dihydrodipicolinate synthase/N-acetylneuraminate lyase